MKKMKRAAAPLTKPVPSPYDQSLDDPRAVFKYQSLLQDFEELYNETEAKKKRLEMMKQKRLVLLAEVKFLSRRYKYLAENQSQDLILNDRVQPQKPLPISKNVRREKKSGAPVAASRLQVSRPVSKQKGRIFDVTDVSLQAHSSASEFSQRQKALGKEVIMRNSAIVPDLTKNERSSSRNAASSHKVPPIFDLNEISREEEELQGDRNETIGNEPNSNSVRGSVDDQLNETKASACRNVGNGASRMGKRRISWQDPVALRVGILSPLK